MPPDQTLRTEGNKLLHDTMKQLVTISSGSIVFVIAFLDFLAKSFHALQWKWSVVVGVGGFFICIIASLLMMQAISLNVGAAYTKDFQPVERPRYIIAFWSFLLAIGALVAFVVRNLLGS